MDNKTITDKIAVLKNNLTNLTNTLIQKQNELDELLRSIQSCEQEIAKINAQLPVLHELLESDDE